MLLTSSPGKEKVDEDIRTAEPETAKAALTPVKAKYEGLKKSALNVNSKRSH